VNITDALACQGVCGETSQPEIEALARAGGVPDHHIDTRDPMDRMRSWLRYAQDLEAVRVTA
jgi:hypothetical protein